MKLFEATGLSKRFGAQVVLQDISLGFEEGQLAGIMGPNGAGKTTCFNVLTGRYRPDRGTVRVRFDLARDAAWVGRKLQVQVLRPGETVPEVTQVHNFRVGPVVDLKVPMRRTEGDWFVLRIADPSQPNATPGPAGHPCNNLGVAYTSPIWLLAT